MTTKKPQKTTSKKSKWTKVGVLLKSKNGNGYYIKVENDIELEKGETLVVRSPKDGVLSLLERGIISQEEADSRMERIPDYVKFEIFSVPSNV